MAKDAKQYGPTAGRVAANVRALREARGLSLGALSTRLVKVGQPISLAALSKLELGQRRVDVDDLVALAVALGVAPSRLLLPATADDGQDVDLTPGVSVPELDAWRWAAGEAPLPAMGGEPFDLDDAGRFVVGSRPHDPPDDTLVSELSDHGRRGDLAPLAAGYRQARAAGLTHGALVGYLGLLDSLGSLADQIGEGADDGER